MGGNKTKTTTEKCYPHRLIKLQKQEIRDALSLASTCENATVQPGYSLIGFKLPSEAFVA